MHEHLGRAVVHRAQLLDPAIAKQLLLDELAAGVVVAKQVVHLPGLHQLDEAQLDGLVPDPGQKLIQLLIVEPLEQHRIDLHRLEAGGQCRLYSLHHLRQLVLAGDLVKLAWIQAVDTDIEGIESGIEPLLGALLQAIAIGGHGHLLDAGGIGHRLYDGGEVTAQ
jgi:hypothetical protein